MSAISINRHGVLFFSSLVGMICEMNSFLSDVAGLPIMGDGRRCVDFPSYKGVSMRSRPGAPGEICVKAGRGSESYRIRATHPFIM